MIMQHRHSALATISSLILLAASLCATIVAPLPVAAAEAPEPQIELIQATAAGQSWQVHTQIFKPEGKGPFPLIVFSHGRAPKAADRQALQYPVLRGHVAYWLRKGFAVIAPIRPGYGATGGADLEANAITISAAGMCSGTPKFDRAIGNAADIVSDVVAWARQQKWVNGGKIILVGQSVGGITTVAAASRNLPGVIGAINFSGGTGGDPEKRPSHSCFPEAITDLYKNYGRTSTIASLWLYAPNDLFWGPTLPKSWHQAFAAAGGRAKFVLTGPVPNEDGHKLLAKGGRLWSSQVDPFIVQLGFK
ncbi:MAG: dipeptidyl aminopeptidase [Alphaproteobacteria bacterium]|nr:dipeptidyl aminopeptidase [Alphaproteobacteria bacterium]